VLTYGSSCLRLAKDARTRLRGLLDSVCRAVQKVLVTYHLRGTLQIENARAPITGLARIAFQVSVAVAECKRHEPISETEQCAEELPVFQSHLALETNVCCRPFHKAFSVFQRVFAVF